MSAPTLLLSDLHLPNTPSPLRERFVALLDGRARGAMAVYLLGDLFEYWIGDDIGLDHYAPEVQALRRLTDSGVRVYFMHGNRDFFVGAGFAEATGVVILPDPTRITLGGVPTLLSHGDRYCTDDLAYQRWRRTSRSPRGQRLFLRLPRSLRERVAASARRRSEAHYEKQQQCIDAAAIMDVNEGAIREAFVEYGAERMIHGHTHRPAEHLLTIEGEIRKRIVLPDWREDVQDIVVSDDAGLRRESAVPGF